MDVRDMYDNADYSDLTIKFAGREIQCHKMILCKNSAYFNKLCGPGSPFLESGLSVIELFDDAPEGVESMLRFIYGVDYEELHANSGMTWLFHLEVATTADKYMLETLRRIALRDAVSRIRELRRDGVSSIVQALRRLPDYFYLSPEIEKAAEYVQRVNHPTLLRSFEYRDFMEDHKEKLWDLLTSRVSKDHEIKSMNVCRGCGFTYMMSEPNAAFPECPACHATAGVIEKVWLVADENY